MFSLQAQNVQFLMLNSQFPDFSGYNQGKKVFLQNNGLFMLG